MYWLEMSYYVYAHRSPFHRNDEDLERDEDDDEILCIDEIKNKFTVNQFLGENNATE